MARKPALTARIVEYVRKQMSDKEILALVRDELDDLLGAFTSPMRRDRPAKSTGKSKRRPGRPRKRRASAERVALLAKIEKIVRASKGVAASQVAKAAAVVQTRV